MWYINFDKRHKYIYGENLWALCSDIYNIVNIWVSKEQFFEEWMQTGSNCFFIH